MTKQKKPVTVAHRVNDDRNFTAEEKQLVIANFKSEHWTAEQAAIQTGCSIGVIYKWLDLKKKHKTSHQNGHRPSFISKERQEALNKAIDKTSTTGLRFSKSKFRAMLQQAADETADEYNKDRNELTDRFVREYMLKHDIKLAKGQVVDNAHKVALEDPRHAASHAAVMHMLHDSVPDGFFFNLDKTSFELKSSDHEAAETVYRGKREQSLKCEDPYTTGGDGNCAVHLFVVANAGGKLGDLVYLVKDKHMPKDKIDVHKAPILDASLNACAMSYVIFVGESTSNKDVALEWMLRNVVVPFVDHVRTRAKMDVKTPASLTVDGDPRQLQVITGEGIRAEFLKANIIASKSPASCTPIYQPLDVGKLFLASKSRFANLLKTNYKPEKEEVEGVKEIFQQHLANYPQQHRKDGAPSMEMSAYFKNAQKCLLLMSSALRTTLTADMIKKSFKDAGVSPFNAESVRKVCQYNWSPADKKQFVTAVPELARRMKDQGELYEKDFDENKIPVNNKSKDGAPVHQRRALVLNAPHVLQDLAVQAAKRQKK